MLSKIAILMKNVYNITKIIYVLESILKNLSFYY